MFADDVRAMMPKKSEFDDIKEQIIEAAKVGDSFYLTKGKFSLDQTRYFTLEGFKIDYIESSDVTIISWSQA